MGIPTHKNNNKKNQRDEVISKDSKDKNDDNTIVNIQAMIDENNKAIETG